MQEGFSKENALQIAVDFTVECIRETLKNKDYHWYGVDFEKALPKLIRMLN